MKRLIALVLSVILTLSCGVISAFAANSDGASVLATGSSTQTIYINGIPYQATLSVAGSVNTGGYSVFTTNARCIRYHYTVKVTYRTEGTGQEIYSGGSASYLGSYDSALGRYVGCTGTTRSGYVKYGGTDTATAIRAISTTGNLTTVNQSGSTQSYNFSAGV